MAGFELTRIGTMGEIAREWKGAKYIPLYIAGIAIGVAAGLGIAMQANQEPASAPTRAVQAAAPLPAEPAAPGAAGWNIAPSFVPAAGEGVLLADAPAALPETLFAPLPAEPAPAAPEAPIAAPAAPIAPAAASPAQSLPAAAAPTAAPEAAPAAAPAAPAPAPVSNFYVPSVAGGGASNLEQRLFDGMNSERAKAGLAPLAYDAGLTKVARTRSQQMTDQGYFSHVDPNGYSMYTALLKYFGYTSYAWAGENLAMNNYGAAEASERSLATLMNSPTHRANILASDFSRVGVGEVTTSDGRHIFTMIFLG